MAKSSPSYSGRVFAIVGRSGVGKTTLLEALIPALKQASLKVATIKHTHHNLNLHSPLSDSFRHRAAGADFSALSGPGQCSLVMEGEWSLDQVLSTVPKEVDVILLEGYKACHFPKVEVIRDLQDPSMLDGPVWMRVTSFQVEEVGNAILSLLPTRAE